MKKINLFLLAATVAVSSVFTGCSSDENAVEPALTVTASSTTIEPGQEVTFNLDARAGDANLDFITIKKGTDFATDVNDKIWTGQDEGVNTGKIPSAQNEAYQADATFKLLTVGTYEFTFKVTDKDGLTATVTMTITVSEAGPVDDLISYTDNKILGSYSADPGSSFASVSGTIYQLADAKANSDKVDFLFYYGASNLATIAAPNEAGAATIFNNATNGIQTWSVKNATKFKKVTVDFAATTNSSSIPDVAADGTDKVASLAVNDVIAFKTAATSANASKKGLIKVVSITGTGGTATMKIEVKVQE